MSILSSSANLLRLDISNLSSIDPLEVEFVVQSEMMPKKIREFHTSNSLSRRPSCYMLKGKMMDDQLSTSRIFDDSPPVSRLNGTFGIYMKNAKLLEKLHL